MCEYFDATTHLPCGNCEVLATEVFEYLEDGRAIYAPWSKGEYFDGRFHDLDCNGSRSHVLPHITHWMYLPPLPNRNTVSAETPTPSQSS